MKEILLITGGDYGGSYGLRWLIRYRFGEKNPEGGSLHLPFKRVDAKSILLIPRRSLLC